MTAVSVPAPSAARLLRSIERACAKGNAHDLAVVLDDVGALERWCEEGCPLLFEGEPSSPALDEIRRQPGISTPELASALGVPGSTLRGIMAALSRTGHARKHGGGWYPTRAGA